MMMTARGMKQPNALCEAMHWNFSWGSAAAAFHIIWAKFDKIHRVIRDLKLAEACCNKIFEKTKLWSTYLYGLNDRPFGSGSNHTLKSYLGAGFSLGLRTTWCCSD